MVRTEKTMLVRYLLHLRVQLEGEVSIQTNVSFSWPRNEIRRDKKSARTN